MVIMSLRLSFWLHLRTLLPSRMSSLGTTCRVWAQSSHPCGGRPVAMIGWDSPVVVVGWDLLSLVFVGGIRRRWAGFARVGPSSTGGLARVVPLSLGGIRRRWGGFAGVGRHWAGFARFGPPLVVISSPSPLPVQRHPQNCCRSHRCHCGRSCC